jgi:hypothetical protein
VVPVLGLVVPLLMVVPIVLVPVVVVPAMVALLVPMRRRRVIRVVMLMVMLMVMLELQLDTVCPLHALMEAPTHFRPAMFLRGANLLMALLMAVATLGHVFGLEEMARLTLNLVRNAGAFLGRALLLKHAHERGVMLVVMFVVVLEVQLLLRRKPHLRRAGPDVASSLQLENTFAAPGSHWIVVDLAILVLRDPFHAKAALAALRLALLERL